MRMMISLFLLLFFAFLSAYMAKQRGRNPVAWFTIGILLGIFSPILLLILKRLPLEQVKDEGVEESDRLKLTSSDQGLTKSNADKVWYYMDKNHLQQGPVYYTVLKSMLRDEKITRSSYVWSEGMSHWQRISELPGFIESGNGS